MKQRDICKAFGNEERLRLIACLARAKSVGELGEGCTLAQSALSQHLRVLRDAGLVTATKHGRSIVYQVADPKVSRIALQLLNLSH